MGLKDEFEQFSALGAARNAESEKFRTDGVAELDRCFKDFAQMMLKSEVRPEPLGIGRVSSKNQRFSRGGLFKRDQVIAVKTWESTPIDGGAGWVLGSATPRTRPRDDYESLDTWVVPEWIVVTTEGLISWTIQRSGGIKDNLGTLNPGMYLHAEPVAVSHAPQFDIVINRNTTVATQVKPDVNSSNGFQIQLREQDPQIMAPHPPGEWRPIPHTQWLYEAYEAIMGAHS